MGRLGELDLPDRLAPYAPAWATQIGFGLMCLGGAIVLRVLLDFVAPGVAPFALIYPAVLIAALFARWQSGVFTAVAGVLLAWYFVLPVRRSFVLADAADGVRIAILTGVSLVMVLIAELFRRTARHALVERDRQLAERDLFLEEFDHRVKNNFALVASLLDLQRRRAGEGETAEALAAALARVESIARAHRHLYRGGLSAGAVDMAAYLDELCTALSDALFLRGAITLDCRSEPAALPRDRAVSIGLIVNELVTNAAKHAFAGRDAGRIQVRFAAAESGWTLSVSDNGTGMPPETRTKGRAGGLGQRLIEGFVRQARGTVSTESGSEGTAVTVALEP